ncbi:hypothetical protein CPB83DRAFT_777339, partial [Crepidotus variabilis]
PGLRGEYVWDGFILLSLLWHHISRGTCPVVLHSGDQSKRFEDAMIQQNTEIKNHGQPEWAHFCDKCCRTWTDKAHCPKPLVKNSDRFCPNYKAQINVCAIVNCSNAADSGYMTCGLKRHRESDENRIHSNKGFFQLQSRLAHQKVSHPNNAFEAQATEEGIEEETVLETNEQDLSGDALGIH